jgi:outer membrane protein OmpA-like peptidoglycan-associated protein
VIGSGFVHRGLGAVRLRGRVGSVRRSLSAVRTGRRRAGIIFYDSGFFLPVSRSPVRLPNELRNLIDRGDHGLRRHRRARQRVDVVDSHRDGLPNELLLEGRLQRPLPQVFRLGEVVSLYLDVNLIGTENPLGLVKLEDGTRVINSDTKVYARPLYMPSATVGVTFNISHKKNFDRFKSVGVWKSDYDKLYNENGELRERVGNLEQQNEELRKNLTAANSKPAQVKEVVVEKTRVLVGSNIITFPIGSCELSDTEKAKVEAFAKSLDNDTLVQVMGSADSKTGTETRNFALAKNRARVVAKILKDNGISENRISEASTIDATDNVKTSRSAILTLSVE